VRRRSSWALATLGALSDPPDDPLAPLSRGLDEASGTLAGIASLTRAEAERIGVRIDRLTSQLACISPSGRADIDRAD
jgi:hypothetical protein